MTTKKKRAHTGGSTRRVRPGELEGVTLVHAMGHEVRRITGAERAGIGFANAVLCTITTDKPSLAAMGHGLDHHEAFADAMGKLAKLHAQTSSVSFSAVRDQLLSKSDRDRLFIESLQKRSEKGGGQ